MGLGIIWKTFYYIFDRHFTFVTDHKELVNLLIENNKKKDNMFSCLT